MLVDLGNFAAEVRALAEQCDPQATAEAATLELPAIISGYLGVSNEQHDAEIAALQEHIMELRDDLNILRCQMEDSLADAYEEVDAMRAQRDQWIAYALKSLNYTDEECAECIEDVPDLAVADVEYAKTILDAWNPATTSIANKWKNNTKIRIFPHIDTSKVTNTSWAWYACTNLRYAPHLDFPNLSNAAGAFDSTSISRLPITNFYGAKNIDRVYSQCYRLGDCCDQTLISTAKEAYCKRFFWKNEYLGFVPPKINMDIEEMGGFFSRTAKYIEVIPDYSNVEPMYIRSMFWKDYGESVLRRIEGLNFARLVSSKCDKGANDPEGSFENNGLNYANAHLNLRYIRIINLGQGSCTDIDLHGVPNWGDGGGENLQSLVDSLITNSYDRAAAGMETCVLTLPKQVWARLTEAQQAEVTAKGFCVVLSNY